jgi:hypothetical protein
VPAARACMHAPVLARVAEAPESARAWELRPNERPDERFGLLHRFADACFWIRAWEECAAAVAGALLLAALEASDHDASLRPQTYDDAFADPPATSAHVLHSAVVSLLAEPASPD